MGEETCFLVIHAQTSGLSGIDLMIGFCWSAAASSMMLGFTWNVDSDLLGSDHFPTYVKLANPCDASRLLRWRLDKADSATFERLTTFAGEVDTFSKRR